jgi:tRNA 2-thiouridine synthesizing protein A
MADRTLDASGLQCPMPLLKTKRELNTMAPGEQLEVVATDPGSARDIPAFIALSAHHLVESAVDGSQCRFVIRCGGAVNV